MSARRIDIFYVNIFLAVSREIEIERARNSWHELNRTEQISNLLDSQIAWE
jgi:hypothetical protein